MARRTTGAISAKSPVGQEVLDFYHAAEHLGDALGAADGEGTSKYQERLETLSAVLRDAPEGVDTVIGARGARGRVPPVVRPFIRRLRIFVSIATGCAIATYGRRICPLALGWWKRRVKRS